MCQTFREYCRSRDRLLGEMAQSRGDPKGIQIHLDDEDRDFIAQAVAQGISAVSALRTRYTLLLLDKPGESGPVRFFGSGRRPFIIVNIERTHLKHLQDKLRSLGAVNIAAHGLTPLTSLDPADTAAYFNASFGRQNAADILRSGKPLQINYGRPVETNVTLKNGTRTAAARTPSEPETARSATVRPVPNDWSASYLPSLFQDKGEVGELMTLSRLPGNQLDFSQVWRSVQSLVGDTRQPGKYILPEAWELFQYALPEAGEAIYNGVVRQLKNYDPAATENVPELKQALMQTTAMILSHPLRGAKIRTSDFLRDVQNLFADRGQLRNLAMSYTSQGHLRKSSGINTTNTRRREIGGVMSAKPHDLDTFGQEDQHFNSDTEIAAELDKLEPVVEKIRAKLQRYNWDQSRLNDQDLDLLNHYEDLTKRLQRLQQPSRGGGQWTGASSLPRKPTTHPQQARLDQIEAELERLGPKVHPIIGKLDMSNWNMSRVSDNEWALFQRYKQLEKELNLLKGMPLIDVDDLAVPARGQDQMAGVRSECVACTLGFRDWLRNTQESSQAWPLCGSDAATVIAPGRRGSTLRSFKQTIAMLRHPYSYETASAPLYTWG